METITWTRPVESAVLELYSEVTKKYNSKMKTAKDKRRWMLTRLCADVDLDFNVKISEVTLKQLKDKVDGMKRTGRRLVDKHIRPILKKAEREATTGAAVDEDDDRHAKNPLDDIDWHSLHRQARWPHLKRYFELFGDHPTLSGSLAHTADTAPSSDVSDHDPDDDEVEDDCAASEGIAHAENRRRKRPFSPPTSTPPSDRSVIRDLMDEEENSTDEGSGGIELEPDSESLSLATPASSTDRQRSLTGKAEQKRKRERECDEGEGSTGECQPKRKGESPTRL